MAIVSISFASLSRSLTSPLRSFVRLILTSPLTVFSLTFAALLVPNCPQPHFKSCSACFLSFLCSHSSPFTRVIFDFLLPPAARHAPSFCSNLSILSSSSPAPPPLLLLLPPVPVILSALAWKWATAVRWEVCRWFDYKERGQRVVWCYDDCSKVLIITPLISGVW